MTPRHYYGVIEASDGDGFSIYFPDFPGCASGGETIDDVIAMGTEALQFHIDGMVEDGDIIPLPSTVDFGAERADTPEAKIHALVAIAVKIPAFPDTISVSMKASVIREIMESVKGNSSNFSHRLFLERAARNEIERLKKSA